MPRPPAPNERPSRSRATTPRLPDEHCDGCQRMVPGKYLRNVAVGNDWKMLCGECRDEGPDR